MRRPLARGVLLALACLLPGLALATPPSSRIGLGGYFRVQARPDFQGGNGRLGYWNLYGRLLNEGPYAMADLRIRLLDADPGTNAPWADAHVRLEGGSIAGASPDNGSLASFRLSQVFVRTGNVLLPNVTWQIGTLDTWFGDLGLYDMRPSELFGETLGLSAQWKKGPVELLIGGGDAGFGLRGLQYSPAVSGGGYLRVQGGKHVEAAVGGQVNYETPVRGSRNAPNFTPGIDYEDWVRGEVVSRFVDENPGRVDDFPDPEATRAVSAKAIAYLGFGNLGPLRWNSLYASYDRVHPEHTSTETYEGEDITLYTTALTDERHAVVIGDELQLTLVKNRWDLTWDALYGNEWDGDNDIVPSSHDRWYASTVLRTQVYVSPTVHVLVETSYAHEKSRNGNTYRDHGDSIFESADGLADSEGLEFGDSDVRRTWQGKGGLVLNPLGPGVYVRPSFRLLYGAQYSTQSNAFGNSFVSSLSDLNDFGAWETHWHHLISVEVETWF